MSGLAATMAALVLVGPGAAAGEADPPVAAVGAAEGIRVDGVLDEAAWARDTDRPPAPARSQGGCARQRRDGGARLVQRRQPLRRRDLPGQNALGDRVHAALVPEHLVAGRTGEGYWAKPAIARVGPGELRAEHETLRQGPSTPDARSRWSPTSTPS